MSGHNKWSKIKHVKAKEDAKKGKLFSKLSKEISIAARDGGGEPGMNPRLRGAVDAARSVSMPKDNIERAIKKGTGELGGDAIEEVTYEGFGPGGVAILVEVCTDNKNRSVADIRMLFNKGGGNLGDSGSVAYQFRRCGEVRIAAEGMGDERMLELAMEAGAEDVIREEDDHVLYTAPDALARVAAALEASLGDHGLKIGSQGLVYRAGNPFTLSDPDAARKALKLCDVLEEYDDTLNVFTNLDLPEEVAAEVFSG